MAHPITLYDLAAADGRRFSPYCWRVRMALAHKGIPCKTVATRFSDIPAIAGGQQKSVPVIDDAGRIVADSWAIANYLEETYAHAPSLFGGERGRALALFLQNWTNGVLHPGILTLILCDIHGRLDEADKPYFRLSREKRFGRALEEVQGAREAKVEEVRKSMQPLRLTLAAQPYLAGDTPAYADYVVFGALQWPRLISDFPVLAPDDPLNADPLNAWFERCLDLFDGLGRRAYHHHP